MGRPPSASSCLQGKLSERDARSFIPSCPFLLLPVLYAFTLPTHSCVSAPCNLSRELGGGGGSRGVFAFQQVTEERSFNCEIEKYVLGETEIYLEP